MWIRLGDFVCFVCLALAFLLPLGRSILMLLFGVLVPCLHFFLSLFCLSTKECSVMNGNKYWNHLCPIDQANGEEESNQHAHSTHINRLYKQMWIYRIE